MDDLVPILGILVALIPVAGLTLAVTLRFAIKPLVETVTKALRESRVAGAGAFVSSPDLEDVHERIAEMQAEIAQLREGQDFQRRLIEETRRTD